MDSEKHEIIIRPDKGFSAGWRELRQYSELLYFFSWKEIKVRYKQAFLGVLWTVLQPLALMFIFVFLLNKGLGISTGNIPAPLYYLSGLILWNLFNQSVSGAAQSIISNAAIIKKIYFPRLIIPVSAIITASFDFLISLILFIGLLLYYRWFEDYTFSVLYIMAGMSIAFLMVVITAFGIGTLLSAINVKYRDVRYALPFMMQALFFITPVMYDTQTLTQNWLIVILELNPLYYAIHIVRESMISGNLNFILTLPVWIVGVLILLYLSGIMAFRRMEAYFADIV